jgi:hypothetical protein
MIIAWSKLTKLDIDRDYACETGQSRPHAVRTIGWADAAELVAASRDACATTSAPPVHRSKGDSDGGIDERP